MFGMVLDSLVLHTECLSVLVSLVGQMDCKFLLRCVGYCLAAACLILGVGLLQCNFFNCFVTSLNILYNQKC